METFSEQLSQRIRRLKGNIHAVPEHELSRQPAPGKWSKKEILGHLIDSARHNWARFCDITSTPSPYRVQAYRQDELVALNQYQQADTDQLVGLWQGLNAQIARLLATLTPEQLALPVMTVSGETHTFHWLIADYVEHLDHHLEQILPPEPTFFPYHITLESALETLREKAPAEFVKLLEIGDLQVEYYKPDKIDRQKPHIQDELYVIISGEGDFIREQDLCRFKPHDVLYVKAGEEHRFVNFTDDFATWVVFYGVKR